MVHRKDLTTNQAAQRLRDAGLPGSRPTIIRWSDDKILPHYRTPGGRYRYFRPEVIELLIKLYRSGLTDTEQMRKQLYELHDQLAERDNGNDREKGNAASSS